MIITNRQCKVRVLIVDDHELTRLTLKLALSKYKEIEVIDSATNGLEAVEKVKSYRPDVIILDLQMPILNGLSAASQIKLISPYTKILAYTSFEDPQTEVMSQTAPIDKFCHKDLPLEQLANLVKDLGKQPSSTLIDN
ncbi:response regulator receiver protein [Gloeothece citriformis PCC 7424]|uniref:Response regulator receiver protein n=1 Tax=Gloeothece citriformis (strain PCC 7424) TaxID=65393 RepID=B7KAJ9_GLOC7|nr:response regulator transcription factor [Gloeothece citriformis]ACK68671.1 response regulator receiver protein [Gloeothece citriformis PCC 7424]